MTRYGVNKGWYGNSAGHSLAAKGIKLYASKPSKLKTVLYDPIYYSQKTETLVPFTSIMDAVRQGKSYNQIKAEYASSDAEDIRLKGIKAIETMDGGSTISQMNRNGVDQTVVLANKNPKFKESVKEVLANPQKSSFLHPVKVKSLQDGLRSAK
jgi:hypothetical protein